MKWPCDAKHSSNIGTKDADASFSCDETHFVADWSWIYVAASMGSLTQTLHAGRVAALGKWSAMAATVALHFQCSTTDLFRCPADE